MRNKHGLVFVCARIYHPSISFFFFSCSFVTSSVTALATACTSFTWRKTSSLDMPAGGPEAQEESYAECVDYGNSAL